MLHRQIRDRQSTGGTSVWCFTEVSQVARCSCWPRVRSEYSMRRSMLGSKKSLVGTNRRISELDRVN